MLQATHEFRYGHLVPLVIADLEFTPAIGIGQTQTNLASNSELDASKVTLKAGTGSTTI